MHRQLEATAMDVGVWLRELALEQYAAAFRANDVDVEVLPTLTADELKDIGVSSIRHRRRLLKAIVALRLEAAQDRAFVPVSPGPPTDPAGSLGEPVQWWLMSAKKTKR